MKTVRFLPLILLFLAWFSTVFSQQRDDYPENYWLKVQEDLNKLSNLKSKKLKALEVAPARVVIDGIDTSEFPVVRVFISVYDSEGNPIPDLDPSVFSMWEEHLLSGNKKLTPTITQLKETASELDIVFCIDTTGSMWDEIDLVKSNLLGFIDILVENKVNFRLAGISFGDEVPYRGLKPFTSDAADFAAWVAGLEATGGGDWPENPLDCIISASRLDFRTSAQKVIVLITDAPAHVAGDGGDSPTTATFTAAYAAISSVEGLKLYYSSPETEYSALGSPLGWPFSGSVLVSTLGTKLVVKYIASYTSPFVKKDGKRRTVTVRVKSGTGTATGTGEYEPPKDVGAISGLVTNKDEPPDPIKDAEIIIRGGGTSIRLKTDANGKFGVEDIPVGTYEVIADKEDPDDDRERVSKTVVVEKDKVTNVTFRLGLETVRDKLSKKYKLIDELSNWGAFWGIASPFADEEAMVKGWVDSIPPEGTPDYQAEALTRMIWAEEAVYESTKYATEDAKKLGSGLAGAAWNILDALNMFEGMTKTIKELLKKVEKFVDVKLIGTVIKKLYNILEKFEDKIRELIGNFSKLILDATSYVLDKTVGESTVKDSIISVLKDTISYFTSDKTGSSSLELITKKISENIASQIVVPLYGNAVDKYIMAALKEAEAAELLRKSDPVSLREARAKYILAMTKMRDNFNAKKSVAGTGEDVDKIFGLIGDFVEMIKPITDGIRKYTFFIPGINSVTVSIASIVDGADKAIKVLRAATNVVAVAGPAGLHLVELPGDVNAAVGAAFNRDKIMTVVYSKAGTAFVKYEISANVITTLSLRTQEYVTVIDRVIDSVTRDDIESLLDSGVIDDLLRADDALEEAYKTSETALMAGAVSDIGEIPAFDVYFNRMLSTGASIRLDRVSFYFKFFYYLLYSSIYGADPSDDKYASLKEEILNYLYLLRDKAVSYEDTLKTALTIKGFTPKTANVKRVNLSPKAITDSSRDVTVTVTIVNPTTAPVDTLDVRIVPSSRFSIKTGSETQSVSVNGGESVEVSWTLTYTGDIADRIEIVYISLSSSDPYITLPSDTMVSIPVRGADADGDGLPDWWEAKYKISDPNADDDGDGLPNSLEFTYRLDPSNPDSDGDGVNDLMEVSRREGKLLGDINGDGVVNVMDILTVANSARKGKFEVDYDLLPDGTINDIDVILGSTFWGSTLK